MLYKRFKDKYLVRLEKGDDIVKSLLDLAKKEDIKLASVSGLGAVSYAEIGLFNLEEKKYYSNSYQGDFEVSNLQGNLSTKDGEKYVHLHILISDVNQKTFGGHLNRAIVSATAEIVVDLIDGEIDRFLGDNGVNLIKFD
ncbi:MAG: DNA-binding protein [Bacillota bacterium]|nr:DNA-binding protein [Bacillota bacterium]